MTPFLLRTLILTFSMILVLILIVTLVLVHPDLDLEFRPHDPNPNFNPHQTQRQSVISGFESDAGGLFTLEVLVLISFARYPLDNITKRNVKNDRRNSRGTLRKIFNLIDF